MEGEPHVLGEQVTARLVEADLLTGAVHCLRESLSERTRGAGPLLRASDEAHMHGDKAALERLVAFSDAVVAIAITLIVLPLVDHAIDAENATEFFAGNVVGLITALLSFVIVGVFWQDPPPRLGADTGLHPQRHAGEVHAMARFGRVLAGGDRAGLCWTRSRRRGVGVLFRDAAGG